MRIHGLAPTIGYFLFCMASVLQLFMIFITLAVLPAEAWRVQWELRTLTAPALLILAIAVGYWGWNLHRPRTLANRRLYAIWQICLFGVPIFCGLLFVVGEIVVGPHLGIFLFAVGALAFVFSAGAARFLKASRQQKSAHTHKRLPDDNRNFGTDPQPPTSLS